MINKLGILGLGTSSTLHYVDELNKKFLQKFGGYSTCPFIMVNTNFNTINPFLPDQEIDLYKNLLPYLYFIEQISIKHLLVPNITIHEVLDKMMFL
jgi:aspartate racemase